MKNQTNTAQNTKAGTSDKKSDNKTNHSDEPVYDLDRPMDLETLVAKCKSQGIDEIIVNQETIDFFATQPGRESIMFKGIRVWSKEADKAEISRVENEPAFRKLFPEETTRVGQ